MALTDEKRRQMLAMLGDDYQTTNNPKSTLTDEKRRQMLAMLDNVPSPSPAPQPVQPQPVVQPSVVQQPVNPQLPATPQPVIQPTQQPVVNKPALPPVVQNLANITQKDPLETQYGNFNEVPSYMLTPEQKESAEHSRRLKMGLPLTGGAESNNFKNVYSKKTPIRDFGVKVGRALAPQWLGIEKRMFGTERERELLKKHEVLSDPYELADQLKSGKIGIDEYQEKVEAYNAYQDATARKARGDRNKRLLAELGLAVGTMGVGSIGNLGAKTAPLIAKGVQGALKAIGVGKKAKPVIGLKDIGKTTDVAKAIGKKAGIVGGHIVDDVTVGATMSGATNLLEQAMGVDTEEGVLGATGQGAVAGGTVGTGFRGIGRAGKLLSRTEGAKKLSQKAGEANEAVADALENAGHTGVADKVRTAPAQWNKFWNVKRTMPWSKKVQDSMTHKENMSNILNPENNAEYRNLEQEIKQINNNVSAEDQALALDLANKHRDVEGNIVKDTVETPVKNTKTEKITEPKAEIQEVAEHKAETQEVNFASAIDARKQRTAKAKEKGLNFAERIKQRKERNKVTEQTTSQHVEDDLSHVKEEIGTNIPKQEETHVVDAPVVSKEEKELIQAQKQYTARSKYRLVEPTQKKQPDEMPEGEVVKLKSGEQERIVVGKAKTKDTEDKKENIYENVVNDNTQYNLTTNDKVALLENGKVSKFDEFYKTGKIPKGYSIKEQRNGIYIAEKTPVELNEKGNPKQPKTVEQLEKDVAKAKKRVLNTRTRLGISTRYKFDGNENYQHYLEKKIQYEKALNEYQKAQNALDEFNNTVNAKEIKEATTETRLDDYNDNVQEADTEYNDSYAQYSNDEVARFIEDCKKTSTKEAIARKQQELGYDENAIAEFQEKLMAESDRRYTKNYKVGEADKKLADEQEAEYIMDVVNNFAVANKGAKKTRKETFTATEEDASYGKIYNISKKKDTDTSGKHEIIRDERVLKEEANIQQLLKERDNATDASKISKLNREIHNAKILKEKAISKYRSKLYEQPKNKVRDNFVNAKDKQAEYDSYIEALTDSKYLGYKNNSNIAQSALDKINEVATDVGGIKTVSSIQKAVNKKGDDVMKSLKEANRIAEETGNLSVGRQIIDDNKDLLDYNLDSDYKAKKGGFDMSELERHYDLSYATSKGQLDALENKSTRRKALKDIYSDNINAKKEFLQGEIEKAKKAGDVKKATKLEAEYHNIELFDSSSYLGELSDADIEHLARARARKIYADNRRIIRRHLVDYDHANKAVYDKNWDDVNRHGQGEVNKPVYRHYYENDMAEYHDPEGLFTSFDNKMRNFLDAEHWNSDFNPWRYNDSKAITPAQVKLTKNTTKADVIRDRYEYNKFTKENRKIINSLGTKLEDNWYKKDVSGNWTDDSERLNNYYNKKVKPIEEKVARLEDVLKTSKDEANIARATDELKHAKKTLEEYKIYKKYTELKAKYEQTKQAYNDEYSVKSKLAKFVNKTKLGIFRKADNPFIKDGADYRDTRTGTLDREAIYKDLKLMRDEKFLKSKAMEEAHRRNKLTVSSKSVRAVDVEKEFRAKLKEMETLYGDIADNFNYKNLSTFKGFKTGARAFELRKSNKPEDIELADMFDENPNVTVEFTKDPDRTHGDYAEVVFDKDGKHTILIHEVPKGMTEADLIREEWEHIRQYNKGEYEKLYEAVKKTEKTHHKYNTNKSTYKEIRKLQKQGVSDEDIANALSDTQKKQITDLEKAKTKQKATKAEKEAHDANYSNDNRPRVLGRSTSSDAIEYEKGETAKSDNRGNSGTIDGKTQTGRKDSDKLSNISDGQSSGSGLTAEDLHGKSLNKSKDYSKLIEKLLDESGNKSVREAKNARKKAVNDLSRRITNSSDLLNATASDFGISEEQQINRILMTEGLNYHATMSKGGRELAWNTGSHEKAGTMGEKTKHTDKPLTASEQYYANKMELKKRTNILTATQHVEDAFGKPIENGKILKGYVPVNKKLLNITLYNRYGKNFYEGIADGEEAINKMFEEENARKAWLSVYKNIDSAKPDFQIPKNVFDSMMLDTGEFFDEKIARYGFRKAFTSSALSLYDGLTNNWSKGVLMFNPRWAFGNTINDATKIIHKENNIKSFAKHFYEALKLDEKHLPSAITENNLFEVEKAMTAYKRFTKNNNINCALNLISGRFISSREGKSLAGKIALEATNVVGVPMYLVNKLADGVMHINSKIQKQFRKTIWVKYLDENQQAKCKNIIQNMKKQDTFFNELSKGAVVDEKIREAGIEEIFSTLGDYATSSTFEQNVIKRIAPFYKWHRHIFKYYADEARRNPSKLALHALYMNKILDDDVDSKPYQRGGIPLSKDLELNAMRYFDITDTAKHATESSFNPMIESVIEGVTGKSTFTGKALTSPNYATDYNGYVIDLKTGEHVRNKDGKKVKRLPMKESLKTIPLTVARMVTLSDSPTVSAERVLGGAYDNFTAKEYKLTDKNGKPIKYDKLKEQQKAYKANKGKAKAYDRLYDTSFGGYNNGDKYFVKDKLKDRYSTEYDTKEKLVKSIIPINKTNKLSKAEQKAKPYEIRANNERALNVLPTKKSVEYKRIAKAFQEKKNKKAFQLINKQIEYKKRRNK